MRPYVWWSIQTKPRHTGCVAMRLETNMSMTAPELTEQQRKLFDALDLPGDMALISTIEKSTGKHRAVVAFVDVDEANGSITMHPVAMLLDGEDDIDLFEPPSTDVTTRKHENG